MIESGRDDLADELRREGLPVQKIWHSDQLTEAIAELSYSDLDTFLAAIGEHHVSARSVAQKIARLFRDGGDHDQLPATVFNRRGRSKGDDDTIGVHVEGLDDLMVRLANCCTPLPGDEIIGFVTRGRGVSVHRSDCANAASLGQEQAMRLIEVEWDSDRRDQLLKAGIEVVALDRSRLLLDIANALGDQGVNILSCDTTTDDDRVAKLRFQIAMSNPAQLASVLNHVKRVDGVFDVYRIVPGAAIED